MANVSDIQEFPYLESDSRKKLDGFITLSDGKNDDMKEVNKYDLRKSLAWDSAFSTSSGILETEELFNASNSWHSENDCEIFGAEKDQLLSCNYMDPETKTVTGEFNLRKSLAWDSAFFTSEGILNPEELSLLNKGFKKSEIDLLPPIEELRISSEWNCTIDSDGSPLATLEVSTNQIREASNTVASSFRNIQHSTKRRDGDCVPKLKVKYSPILRRPTVNGNQLERNDKISSIPPSWKFSASSEISDLSSSLKPPKISRRIRRNAPIAPIDRVPLLSNEVNGESKTVKASGKCLMEKSSLSKTRRDDNSSCTTLSRMNGYGLFSHYNKLSPCQSSPKVSIVKSDTSSRNPSASNVSLIHPPKYRITNQITPENCTYQTHSSIKKNRCCKSPSTSVDGFSLASPMGESIVYKEIICSNPCVDKRIDFVSFDTSRTGKSSGLRMPSPKIDFFDMDNFMAHIENRDNNLHSGAVSKTQGGQILNDVRNKMTCTWNIKSTISGAVSKVGEDKDCLKSEKMVNVRARAH